MRRKLNKLGKAAAFFAFGALIFCVIQEILMPCWTWPHFKEIPENALAELAQLEDSDIQVVFLRTSYSQWSISPMQIYERTEIATYNLSREG